MFENSIILVTGGTGSWGKELVKQLLAFHPKKVIVLSRNENNQFLMKQDYPDANNIQFFIGDIRDKETLLTAFHEVDYVFHLAALKHVSTCEDYPIEALKTNVIGTLNVIDAAISNKVKKVINVSTDKAADPANVYGMTKALAEKLIIQANMRQQQTKFICVRGGNVVGSNGSVLQLFLNQIEENGEILLTDKQMTRFIIQPEQAIELLIKASIRGIGGETFVMNMKACKIIDLAELLISIYNRGTITEIGARAGEKFHEVLVSEMEKKDAVWVDEDFIVAFPTYEVPALKEAYAKCEKLTDTDYSSGAHQFLMTTNELLETLQLNKYM